MLEKKIYTKEAAAEIYKKLFHANCNFEGASALGSYRNMAKNIQANYPREYEAKMTKLNELIGPYHNDISNNPGKVL